MARKRYIIPAPEPKPWIRFGLLSMVPMLLFFVWSYGQTYDRGLITFEPTINKDSISQEGSLSGLFPLKLINLERNGAAREFEPSSLFQYVNGHANYYIEAGVKRVGTAEYALAGKPVLVVDIFNFDKSLHAFGVLMEEVGQSSQSAPVGEIGFVSSRSAHFITGPNYVRINLYEEAVSTLDTAKAIAAGIKVEAGEKLVFRFPNFGETSKTRFIKSGYRGMDFFNNIVEREFLVDGKQAKAFMITKKKEEVAKIKGTILAFLQEDGIPYTSLATNQNITIYLVTDRYEGPWFFYTYGNRLIGGYWKWNDATKRAVEEDIDGK